MKKYSGLTLIEVLIASIILFMTLGLVSAIVQHNINTQHQALKYLQLMADTPSVNANIVFEINQGATNGNISLVGREYTWTASLISSEKPIMDVSPETGQQVEAESQVSLFQIDVEGPANINYSFRRMVWQNNGG